jgi:hypothetical protein
MGGETAAIRKKKRLDASGRVLRRGPILVRLRESAGYDEIARKEEELGSEHVRQIVREALAECIVDGETDHAKRQWRRLAPAMQIAGMAAANRKADPGVPQCSRSARPRLRRQSRPGHGGREGACERGFGSLGLERGGERKKCPGGRRKPLKRLISAKEIQGFPWLKFGRALPDSAPIWLDLDSALSFLARPRGAAG